MKLSSIKTQEQFWDMGDNWYQRAHRLRRVYQDSKQPLEKRTKALSLWMVMNNRVMNLQRVAVQMTIFNPSKSMESGMVNSLNQDDPKYQNTLESKMNDLDLAIKNTILEVGKAIKEIKGRF